MDTLIKAHVCHALPGGKGVLLGRWPNIPKFKQKETQIPLSILVAIITGRWMLILDTLISKAYLRIFIEGYAFTKCVVADTLSWNAYIFVRYICIYGVWQWKIDEKRVWVRVRNHGEGCMNWVL